MQHREELFNQERNIYAFQWLSSSFKAIKPFFLKNPKRIILRVYTMERNVKNNHSKASFTFMLTSSLKNNSSIYIIKWNAIFFFCQCELQKIHVLESSISVCSLHWFFPFGFSMSLQKCSVMGVLHFMFFPCSDCSSVWPQSSPYYTE